MQVQIFTVPIGDNGTALKELNTFLRGHKILEVDSQLIGNEHGASWCFCVRYIELGYGEREGGVQEKVDYRKVLDEATFQKFSKLREIRKKVSAEEAVSAFIVFTDEELAELARLDEITEKSMLSVKGIGEKKVARYARYFIKAPDKDETTGIPS
jgi:superfamily II DNA helicase RecQ